MNILGFFSKYSYNSIKYLKKIKKSLLNNQYYLKNKDLNS